MSKKKLIKLELMNTRYTRRELKDHASEFIHYARYAGYILNDFNPHLSAAKLHPLKPNIAERNHRLVIETTIDNAKILYQIIQIYPSFSNWRIKVVSPNVDLAPSEAQKKAVKKEEASAKKPAVKKAKPAKKTVPKSAKKVVKKTVKNAVKKTAKKAKPAPAKKASQKPVKKTAKKVVKTAVKKKR